MKTIEKNDNKQEALKSYIYELSEKILSEYDIKKMAINLDTLYENGFRHKYSVFFPYILEISQDNNEYSLDYLGENLEELLKYVESKKLEYQYVYPNLIKLCDHINLEIGRYNYYSTNEKRIHDIEAKMPDLRSQVLAQSMELQRATKKASSLQTELITVLSIFSAIVIAFFGGINFIGNALSGMQSTIVYKSILIVLVCGIVLVNAIFLLIYLVGKITERNIYARCKSDSCTCSNGSPKCKPINRIRKRLPYIFYLNIFLVLLLIVDVVFWTLDLQGIIIDFF